MEILGIVADERGYGKNGRGMKFRYKLVQRSEPVGITSDVTRPAIPSADSPRSRPPGKSEPKGQTRRSPKMEGIVIDPQDPKRVIISLGSDDGLRVRDTLNVLRDNTYLGRFVVELLSQDKAVGRIDFLQGDLQRGDRVTNTQRESMTAMPKRVNRFPIGGRVTAFASSPDGKLIAFANDRTEILDTETRKVVVSLKLTTNDEDTLLAETGRDPHFSVQALAFSPDGNVLAVGTDVGQVKLFNAWTGELVRSLNDVVRSLNDEQAKLVDKQTPEKLKPLARAMGGVRGLAFSPDGSLLVMCGSSFEDVPLVFDGIERGGLRRFMTAPGRMKIWDVKTGRLKHDLVGHSHAEAVAFSPDGKLLASAGSWMSGGEHGTGVILWNPQDGSNVRIITSDANGGTHSVAFSPDGKLLAIGSQRFDKDNDTSTGIITLARAGTGLVEWQQTVPRWAKPVFLPDGKSVAVLGGGHSIRLFDTATGTVKHEFQPEKSPPADVTRSGPWIDFAITPQGRRLMIIGFDSERKGSIELWDVTGLVTIQSRQPAVPMQSPGARQ